MGSHTDVYSKSPPKSPIVVQEVLLEIGVVLQSRHCTDLDGAVAGDLTSRADVNVGLPLVCHLIPAEAEYIYIRLEM